MEHLLKEKLITADEETIKESENHGSVVELKPFCCVMKQAAKDYYTNKQDFICSYGKCLAKKKNQIPIAAPVEYNNGQYGVWLHFCSHSCLFDFARTCCEVYLCESRSQTLSHILKILNDPSSWIEKFYWAPVTFGYRTLTIPQIFFSNNIVIQRPEFIKEFGKEQKEENKKEIKCQYCNKTLTNEEIATKMKLICHYMAKTNQFFQLPDQYVCSPGCLLGYYYYGDEDLLVVPRTRMKQWCHKYLFYVWGILHAIPSPPLLLFSLLGDSFHQVAEEGKYYHLIMPHMQFQTNITTIRKPYWTRLPNTLCASSSFSSSSSSSISASSSVSSSSSMERSLKNVFPTIR